MSYFSIRDGANITKEWQHHAIALYILDPDVMGGRPCIRGSRVTVGTIIGLLASGYSYQEILTMYPYLVEEDIKEALAYAAWRSEELDAPLETA